MTPIVFPTLKELGRPEALLRIATDAGGVILISGDVGTGVTTTITALAHELKELGKDPLYISMNETDVLPGIDSISVDTVDDSLFDYFMGDTRPECVIFKDTLDPNVMYLAACLAEAGSLVVGGLRANSSEDAVEKYLNAMLQNQPIRISGPRYLIRLSLFQKFNYNSSSSITKEIIAESLASLRARTFFMQEGVDRYKPNTGHRFALDYQVVTKLF